MGPTRRIGKAYTVHLALQKTLLPAGSWRTDFCATYDGSSAFQKTDVSRKAKYQVPWWGLENLQVAEVQAFPNPAMSPEPVKGAVNPAPKNLDRKEDRACSEWIDPAFSAASALTQSDRAVFS